MMAILTLLAALSVASSGAALHVRIMVDESGKCVTAWNGAPVDDAELLERARAWPDKKKSVHIDGDTIVPYRCLGGTIYALQMAGFTKLGFIAEPAPAQEDAK
ncbi:Biopolymer transport protein ExbD/TolR [hydrothermal vent metagenome]|uniref:Biopolymer transport protein ExbD/TolR n=1 Tax=hydrothermal vent metagenome TaxID=652676 RepID=A0A160TRE7_9ZZZZ